jgi:hypothetical protein
VIASVGVLQLVGVAALAACAVLSVAVAWWPPSSTLGSARIHPAIAVGIAAVAVRLAFLLLSDGDQYDIFYAFRGVGEHVRQGGDAFDPGYVGRQNYAPFMVWWWAFVSWAIPGDQTHVYSAILRLPYLLADAAIAPLLLVVVGGARGLRAGWLYALSPIAIAVSTLHGQDDACVALLLLLAVIVIPRRWLLAAVFVGVAAAVKPWALFFVPALLAGLPLRAWWRFAAVSAAPMALAFAGYALIHPAHIVDGISRMVRYSAPVEGLGTGQLAIGHSQGVVSVLNIVAGVGVIAAAVLSRRRGDQPADAVALGMVLLLALSPTTADQYLMWPIPFLLYAGRTRLCVLLSLALVPATAYLDLWVNQHVYDVLLRLPLGIASVALLLTAAHLLAGHDVALPAWRRRLRSPQQQPAISA